MDPFVTTATEPVLRRSMPELDTLRGVAVLLVVLYHGLFWSMPQAAITPNARVLTAPFRYGWSGVQLFFVLSGFLITGILIRTKAAGHYYRTFYIRRALRILPAFFLLIGTLFATRLISWRYLLVSTAFAANLSPLFGIAMEYPPLWSLAVEEHFYTIWPTLVRRLSVRAIAVIAVILVIASPAIRAWAFTHDYRNGIYFYTWFNVDGLAAGALLAIAARHGRRMVWIATIVFVLAAIALASAALLTHQDITTRETSAGAAFQSTMLYLVYGAMVSLALLTGSSRLRGLVRIAPLQWLGYISYGLYLVHVGCFGLFDQARRWWMGPAVAPYGVAFIFLRFAIGGGIAIGIAALSRRYYEGYFLSLKTALTSESEPPAKKS